MNLDELRSVQSTERKKDSLQNLRPSFYKEVGDYIAELEDERERVAEAADDPFSAPEVGRLTDEIETARDVVEAIYERRMGKLVKQASLAAAGMQADDAGLTAEEQDLFGDLVDRIQSNKNRVLDTLEGVDTDASSDASNPDPTAGADAPAPPNSPSDRTDPATPETPPAPPDDPLPGQDGGDESAGEMPTETATETDTSGVSPADVMGGGPTSDSSTAGAEPPPTADRDDSPPPPPAPDDDPDRTATPTAPSDSATETEAVDRVTVRITQDVGSILGVDDREYMLSCDDVVTLPEQNATPLVEQEAAEPLE